MSMGIPTDLEIHSALAELFDHPIVQNSKFLCRALLPEDPQINKLVGYSVVASMQYLPQKEMQQFCKQLFEIKQNTKDCTLQHRLSLIIYCHIMESDFMFTCIWNLLRLINGDEPSWVMEFKTKNGELKKCSYPIEKMAEIKRQSNKSGKNMQIGNILNSLWNSEIRNAFSHSNYALLPDDNPKEFYSFKSFTTNKRADKSLNKQHHKPIKIEDITRYCGAAIVLNSEFNKRYKPLFEICWRKVQSNRTR